MAVTACRWWRLCGSWRQSCRTTRLRASTSTPTACYWPKRRSCSTHSNITSHPHQFKIGGQWHTWIDYGKFHELVGSGAAFRTEDYMAPTPAWAVFGPLPSCLSLSRTRRRQPGARVQSARAAIPAQSQGHRRAHGPQRLLAHPLSIPSFEPHTPPAIHAPLRQQIVGHRCWDLDLGL